MVTICQIEFEKFLRTKVQQCFNSFSDDSVCIQWQITHKCSGHARKFMWFMRPQPRNLGLCLDLPGHGALFTDCDTFTVRKTQFKLRADSVNVFPPLRDEITLREAESDIPIGWSLSRGYWTVPRGLANLMYHKRELQRAWWCMETGLSVR